jgi:hypothetical protein
MSAAYTRKTGKKVLVPRSKSVPYRSTYAVESVRVDTLVAVPVSKVLRPVKCDVCRKPTKKGSLVLREPVWDYFRTTCQTCAKWVSVDDLL